MTKIAMITVAVTSYIMVCSCLGLAGARLDGFLFRLFGLFPNLDRISISLRDIVAAVVGALLIFAAHWIWQRNSRKR